VSVESAGILHIRWSVGQVVPDSGHGHVK